MKHRPDSTFGTVNSDVLAFKDKSFQPTNFCRVKYHCNRAPVALGPRW
jgi:hypothetical protein